MSEHRVHFVKGDEEWIVSVATGQNLLEAARAVEAPMMTLCHGIGACVQCKVRVKDGWDNLSRPNALERDRLGNVFHLTRERLGCQAEVSGPVLVEVLEARLPKRGRRSRPPRGR